MMVSQLENLCQERRIKVEFIKDKFIDSASEFKYSNPVIKVHKIFKECPMEVAAAVVEIFTAEGCTSECIEIIEGYLKEKFGPVGIKIQPPKVTVTGPVSNVVTSICYSNEENYCDNEELYKEVYIASIDVTNMKGQQKKLNSNEALSVKEQDILEMDIVIIPPLHK